MKKPTRKALERQLATIRGQLEDIATRERLAANGKLLGKCFKYRSCYSCPKTDADYWWVYRRCIEVTADGYAVFVQFDIDKDGKIEIQRERAWHLIDGWRPISRDEWDLAVRNALTAAHLALQGVTA